MKKIYNYTELHKEKALGKKYDEEMYSKDTWSNRIWQIEKGVLYNILKGRENKKILDFATGTGRILEFLEKKRFTRLTGVDSSKEMLNQAKTKLHKSRLLYLNLVNKKDFQTIKKEKFEIITVFRFFLNAEEGLRKEIIPKLEFLLEKKGLFIFNIHNNKKSFLGLVNKFLNAFKRKKEKVLGVQDVKKWFYKTNLEVKEIYSYGFIPHKRKVKILPNKVWYFLEKILASKINLFGSHLLVVCCKKEK